MGGGLLGSLNQHLVTTTFTLFIVAFIVFYSQRKNLNEQREKKKKNCSKLNFCFSFLFVIFVFRFSFFLSFESRFKINLVICNKCLKY